jgi:hypothetical protein
MDSHSVFAWAQTTKGKVSGKIRSLSNIGWIKQNAGTRHWMIVFIQYRS